MTPNIVFSKDAANNTVLNVDASTRINTFFIRVLGAFPGMPVGQWQTMGVAASAQATRAKLVMSLVLDNSTSMGGNGGAGALPSAVASFISLFDDQNDHAAMVSFASCSSNNVPMEQPFIKDITNSAKTLKGNGGYTCSECGMTNAFIQNATITPLPGENLVKVIVFFSDGMANNFVYSQACGTRDIANATGGSPQVFNPSAGCVSDNKCTPPAKISSIDPTAGSISTSNCIQMHDEAERRAVQIAANARAGGTYVYAIGMGNPADPGECSGAEPVLNPEFLKNLANTTDSQNFAKYSSQPVGDYAIAANAGELNSVFQTIAAKILLRLSR